MLNSQINFLNTLDSCMFAFVGHKGRMDLRKIVRARTSLQLKSERSNHHASSFLDFPGPPHKKVRLQD